MAVSRRQFLKSAGAISAGFAGLHTLMDRTAFAVPNSDDIPYGYGELKTDPQGVMDLPEGFSYKIISHQGQTMADGFLVPGRADGMATFEGPGGKTIVIRNHELSEDEPENGPFGVGQRLLGRLDDYKAYDLGRKEAPALGGTTTLVFDTATQELEKQFLSLAGTIRNCAGGLTPWNTWVSCEETTQRAGGTFEKDHGYNFEVPATAEPAIADPIPLKDMGRFNHEAIAVDENSGIVYQTEDRNDGALYRFIPNTAGKLVKGGRLQALAVDGLPSLDTRNWEKKTVQPGKKMAARWVDLDEVDSPEDDLRHRAYDDGAARFARGEGMWAGDDGIYFACTSGGEARKGQIWRYVPSSNEGTAAETDAPGTLELFVEPNDPGLIDNADNLTVSPWGDLIVCEDGSGDQFLVGVTPKGDIYKFAHNAYSDSELAGATFSPDGSTLFVNIQHAHLTLAITGPWRSV